jgi:hypothetical protein
MSRITIDTCVFVHVVNNDANLNDHITHLLLRLRQKEHKLHVDAGNRVTKEYAQEISPILTSSKDIGVARILLRHWMDNDHHDPVVIDYTGPLLSRIHQVIPRNERVDAILVAVGITGNSRLVTNDGEHILGHKAHLLRRTRSYRGNGFDIVDSQRAATLY